VCVSVSVCVCECVCVCVCVCVVHCVLKCCGSMLPQHQVNITKSITKCF